MRLRVLILVSAALFLFGSGRAAAEDAGSALSSDAAITDASGADVTSDGSSASEVAESEVGDGGEQDAQTPVIACDGALCDTTQGRPTCAVASRSVGRTSVDPSGVVSLLAVVAVGLVLRLRRGTQRPTRGRAGETNDPACGGVAAARSRLRRPIAGR